MLGANQIEILILFSGGVFAFVWGFGIALHREIDYDNRILSIILLILGIWLMAGVYFWSGYFLENPNFYLLHLPFVYFSGPILYKYYQNILLEENTSFRQLRWHYILPLLVTVSIIPFHLLSREDKQKFLELAMTKELSIYHQFLLILNLGTKVSILAYFSFILYKNKNLFRDFQNQEHKWKGFILFIALLLYIDLFLGLSGFIIPIPYLTKLSATVLPFIIFFFFILSHKYPEITRGIKQEIKKNRYEKSKIESLDVNSILIQLESLMKKEKLFTDEEISLSSLSENLQISTHQLSQILNERLNKNFYQFINEYRIDEAKKYLVEKPDNTILSIAYSVGFNSKSAFNKSFKQFTGLTPLEYRKKYSYK